MNDITVIILTKNEEANIKRCILSVKELATRIIVVDSGSTDKTCDIAKEVGAEVVVHPFITHGKQFNWALDTLDIKTKWVFRLDADEEVTPELRKEISEECVAHADDNVNGLIVKFKIYFLGKFLKHGGVYPFYRTTIFKYGKGYIDEVGMRDQTIITEGELLYLKNDCLHYDFKSLENWISKHNWYSTLETINYEQATKDDTDANLPESAKKTRKARNNLYYKLPKYFRAKLYYWYRYYLKLGFLDGEAGRIHAFMQAYWYRYLIDAKIYEMETKKNGE
ncbi:MAG: glycosyltransferase family 2 protein [Clostridia bacterium]|nr:glycosyltransferase family 2 protein [Clostridia bacterium]